MGDISRHRDIYLFSREAVPAQLLELAKLTTSDLTYVELGNYLTDVSQFRDPVSYIFAKQRLWREFVVPKAGKDTKVLIARALGAAAAAAGVAASTYLKTLTSGFASRATEIGGAALAAGGGIVALLPSDTFAAIGGADTWIDTMFGTPLERTPGDPKRREEKHYGHVGQFFRHSIEGVTQLLFAQDVRQRTKGDWGRVDAIPDSRVAEIFTEFFTQYYPHEHTDQPPYIWDASKRPAHPSMYGPSRRQRTTQEPDIGVMKAVDVHYVDYLAEGLTDLEREWRLLKPQDTAGRQRMLVRMGKILHGIEDWFFHSNVVEILRLRGHSPARRTDESEEAFLRRFIGEVSGNEPEFVAAKDDPRRLCRLQRKLYRRLRFPVYERGTRTQSAGRLSRTKASTPSLRLAYPAFPSQQDTAHTLVHALENLEHKLTHPAISGPGQHASDRLAGGLPEWVPCVLRKFADARSGEGRKLLEQKAKARGVSMTTVAAALASAGPQREQVHAVIVDVLREWVPLVVTMLDESERQRLAADVSPEQWPAAARTPNRKPGTTQTDHQLDLHRKALEPRPTDDGRTEHNYERAARYLTECGFLNESGRKSLVKAFEVDRASQKLLKGAPGAGAFLMQFSIELQQALDAGNAATEKLDQDKDSVFGQASDNGAFNEIVGSHSLMSKDTLTSTPFFDDAKVLASVASSSVLTIMLEQVGTPTAGRKLDWTKVLHHFIRYPPANGGWERRAILFFRQPAGKIPTYADLPELARVVESAKVPATPAPAPTPAAAPAPAAPAAARKQSKREELEERYIKLEGELSAYRYP